MYFIGSSYRFGDTAGTCSEDDDAEIEDLISVMGTATGYDSDEFADDEGAISQGEQSSSPSPSNASSRHYLRDELDYDHLTAMRTSQPRNYTNGNVLYFFHKISILLINCLDGRVSDYVVESSSNHHYYNTVTNTLASQRSANLVTPSISGKIIFFKILFSLCYMNYIIFLFVLFKRSV